MSHSQFVPQEMHRAIELAWRCRDECQTTLFHHCLAMGGSHVEQSHVKLMADCIQICQSAADFMTRGSAMHAEICRACAAVCEACAASCDEVGGEDMQRCAEICRECAQICRDMAGHGAQRAGASQGQPQAQPSVF